ncbi:hypothetical protein [Reyranella sp.]|uniref:hypothetical protein n=1 Tax=Reyranella sp. TaxID=1929291 RepID=UPI003BA99A78
MQLFFVTALATILIAGHPTAATAGQNGSPGLQTRSPAFHVVRFGLPRLPGVPRLPSIPKRPKMPRWP